jgi:hypothetical protein
MLVSKVLKMYAHISRFKNTGDGDCTFKNEEVFLRLCLYFKRGARFEGPNMGQFKKFPYTICH